MASVRRSAAVFQLQTVVDMSASARQKLSAFLQNPLVAVVQASSVLHCINEYAFSITTVSDGVVPFLFAGYEEVDVQAHGAP